MTKVQGKTNTLKQGPKRHKPWPIQTVENYQDSCGLVRKLSESCEELITKM